MLLALATLLAASQPAPAATAAPLGRTAWLVATVGQSEWCPAGNVRLDLRTGRYLFTARAPRTVCGQAGLERAVRKGALRGETLEAVRAAFLRARSEGLVAQACRGGRRPDEIEVNNGGTPALVLTGGAYTLSAPDEMMCWNDAARALHHALDQIFEPFGAP